MPRVPPVLVAALTVLLALGAVAFACRPAVRACDTLEVIDPDEAPEGWSRRWHERADGGTIGPFTATFAERTRPAWSATPQTTQLSLTRGCTDKSFALVWEGAPQSMADVYVVHVPTSDVYVLAKDTSAKGEASQAIIAVARVRRDAGTRFRPADRMTWLALGLGALSLLCAAIAPLRHRRGRRYHDLHADWKEAVLGPDGRLERSDGSKMGVLDRGRARWAGPVLVAPEAMTNATAFRDGVVVPTRDVIAGGHALHARQAAGALRDARWLTAFALAGSALTVVLTRLG